MTREDAEALVERAIQLIPSEIPINGIVYTFSDIGNISCIGEGNAPQVCKVDGILTAEGSKSRRLPLSQIIRKLSTHPNQQQL